MNTKLISEQTIKELYEDIRARVLKAAKEAPIYDFVYECVPESYIRDYKWNGVIDEVYETLKNNIKNDILNEFNFKLGAGKNTYGYCSYKERAICISDCYIKTDANEDAVYQDLINTIIHEMTHALLTNACYTGNGYFSAHGGLFKYLGNYISRSVYFKDILIQKDITTYDNTSIYETVYADGYFIKDDKKILKVTRKIAEEVYSTGSFYNFRDKKLNGEYEYIFDTKEVKRYYIDQVEQKYQDLLKNNK